MSTDPVDLSLNEVETTTRKALIGRGTDPGTATDVAAAVRWLCERGEDGVGIVLTAIHRSDDFAAIVRAVDAVIAGEGESVIVDHNVVLFAALCGPAAKVFGFGFELVAADWSAVIGAVELAGPVGSGPVSVNTVETVASTRHSAERAQFTTSQVDWKALGALAARIYVPSSDQSRTSGAGAGLTDND